jgi:hypothetical protein
MAARWLALSASSWTAMLVLFGPETLSAKMMGDSASVTAFNAVILALTVLGWADMVWHDIRGKLIWPSFPALKRHQICVLLYGALAGAYGIRAFVSARHFDPSTCLLAGYYLVTAIGIGLVAFALAGEERV